MSDLTEVADKTEETQDTENTEKFLIFSILGKMYCFPSRLIGEIALYDIVYQLPLIPSYVLGVVNRYSIPYALFDIGILFYNTPTPRNKVLIFKDEIDHIAFLIDDVTGIADISSDNIYSLERSLDLNDLTDAVYSSFKWNEQDVFVLDVHRILERVCQETL